MLDFTIQIMYIIGMCYRLKARLSEYIINPILDILKGTKGEKLHAMHVKELTILNGNHILKVSGL